MSEPEKQKHEIAEFPKHVQIGMHYGLIKRGWSIQDYLYYSAENSDGYETICLHGIQGAGKSNRALQYTSWIKERTLTKKLGRPPTEQELWDAVMNALVFSPSDFVKTLEAVPEGEKLDVIVWDDIQLNYTSSTFKTDVDQYAAIDSMFAVIRTKVAIVIITIPNITRLPKNVKDNVTFETYIGKNRLEQIRRIFRLPGTKRIDSNLFKPVIQEPKKFDLYDIPSWAWFKYEKLRVKLANIALAKLKGVTDMEDDENYTPVWDLSERLKINANSLQQMGSRKTIPTKVVNGVLCVPNDFIPRLLKQYGLQEGV